MLLMHDEYQKHTEGFMDVGWLLMTASTSRDVDKHGFKDRK